VLYESGSVTLIYFINLKNEIKEFKIQSSVRNFFSNNLILRHRQFAERNFLNCKLQKNIAKIEKLINEVR